MPESAMRHERNHGNSASQGSHGRRPSPVRFESPVMFGNPARRPSPLANADGVGHRWLLAPSDTCFASPQPAGSITELSAGCYQYKASPEQLLLDLERCNKALRVLSKQNSTLKNQLKEQEGGVNQKTPSNMDREEMERKKKLSFSQAPSVSTIASSHGSAFLSHSEFYNRLMSLSRMADQELAVSAYRDVLLEMGKTLAQWEEVVGQLRRETIRDKEVSFFLEDQLGYEVATFEIERMLLLTELEVQAKEAERAIGELQQQLDSAERRSRWTKNKADARISELSLVLATSHLDVERLQQENDILRIQLEIERQRRDEI